MATQVDPTHISVKDLTFNYPGKGVSRFYKFYILIINNFLFLMFIRMFYNT